MWSKSIKSYTKNTVQPSFAHNNAWHYQADDDTSDADS